MYEEDDNMKENPEAAAHLLIRPFTSKDLDFVIQGQLKLYEAEYGFNSAIWRSYITDGVHGLAHNFDIEKDCILILEHREAPAGCAAVAHISGETAQFRFFFIERELRGLGAGRRLLDAAMEFCREKKYKRVFLWTFSTLHAARHLYESMGFKLTEAHGKSDWGTPITEERWELELRTADKLQRKVNIKRK